MDISQYTLVVDIVEPGKAIGSTDDDIPVAFRREDGKWIGFGGYSDEHRGQGSSLPVAIRRLAKAMGLSGTALLANDARPGWSQTINL